MSTNAPTEKSVTFAVSKTGDTEVISLTLDFTEESEFNWSTLSDGFIQPGDAYKIAIANVGATGVVIGPKGGNPSKFVLEVSANSGLDISNHVRQASDGLTLATAEPADELSVRIEFFKMVS